MQLREGPRGKEEGRKCSWLRGNRSTWVLLPFISKVEIGHKGRKNGLKRGRETIEILRTRYKLRERALDLVRNRLNLEREPRIIIFVMIQASHHALVISVDVC